MSFFRREEGGPEATAESMSRPPNRSAAAVTLVAPGTRIQGTITGTTDVRVEGELVGEVRIDGHLSIGREGKLSGAVSARTVEIAGAMTGDVTAADRIALAATGVAEGDLSAPRVMIAEGAFFKGGVEMGSNAAQRPLDDGAADRASGKGRT